MRRAVLWSPGQCGAMRVWVWLDRIGGQEIKPILYTFRRCPYAIRARLALVASGVELEYREVVLRDKPAAMLEASPKGTVPVLVLPDGEVIDESLEIMHWALAENDPEGWLRSPRLDLIEQNDQQFKPLLDRYKYPNRFPGADAVGAWEGAVEILGSWDRLVAPAWLCGERPGLADFSVFPFVRQFAHVDRAAFAGAGLPALANWLERHLRSERFAAVMGKRPVWQDSSWHDSRESRY